MPHYPEEWKNLNAGLCHDWLTGMRGGERVLEILCRGFPKARIYTLIYNSKAVSRHISRHRVTTSWVQKIPGIEKHYRNLLPLFPSAINSIKPYDAEIIVSCSHCVAKSLLVVKGTQHLCYCFTPMRYAWLFQEEYLRNPVKRAIAAPLLKYLRWWDKKTANRVDRYVAISHHVRQRIMTFYERDADVVYPPADTDYFTLNAEEDRDEADLIISALVPYKKVDLAVEAYNQSGKQLRIVGTGSGFEELKKLAGPNIQLLGRKSDEEIRELYQRSRCLIFPGEEDFGIVPVEAMACGTPVVAFNKGGATETVADQVSGVFFEEQTPESLNEAVERAISMHWDRQAIRTQAEKFSVQNFIDGMNQSIKACLHQ